MPSGLVATAVATWFGADDLKAYTRRDGQTELQALVAIACWIIRDRIRVRAWSQFDRHPLRRLARPRSERFLGLDTGSFHRELGMVFPIA